MFVNSRKVLSGSLALTVAWLFGVAPMAGGNPGVVGVIVRSAHASLGGVAVPDDGDTITAGNSLRIEKGGYALVRLSPWAAIRFSDAAEARFVGTSGHPIVQISSGTVLAARAGTDALVVETCGYRIEPAEQGKTVYLVAMTNQEDAAIVTARAGKLLITVLGSGKNYFLPQGQSASVQGQEPEKQESEQAPGKPAGNTGEDQNTIRTNRETTRGKNAASVQGQQDQEKQESKQAPSKRAGNAGEEQISTPTEAEEKAGPKKSAAKPAGQNQSHTGLILLGVGAAAAAGAAAALGGGGKGGGGGTVVSPSTP